VEALDSRPGLELHALTVLRDGERVLEQYWEPYVAGDRPLVYSASKTFAATAVGLAIGEGRFGLHDRLSDLLGADFPSDPAPGVADWTVHHLLSMSTGHTEDTLPELIENLPPEQWVSGFLALAPEGAVGELHTYNNGASFLLGELVRRSTGLDLLEYLRPRVLEPLGIDATWDRDWIDRCLGWSGLHIDVRGLAAMGELLRCDGVWQGRRLLPEGWVAQATRKQVETAGEDSPEWALGYGYQVWMNREGFRLDGAHGQFAFVLPERGLVVAVQSAQSTTQDLIDVVFAHLDDFAGTAPGEQPVGDEPAASHSVAALPTPSDTGLGAEWAAAGPIPLDVAMAQPGEEVSPAPDLADVRAWRDGGQLHLSMVAEGHAVQLVTEPGTWLRQPLVLGEAEVPVALAAGADEAGDLQVKLVFTETPHTLRLRIGTDGTSGTTWHVPPLHGPILANMRAH